MAPPSPLSLATPRGARPPTARQGRFRGGKLGLRHPASPLAARAFAERQDLDEAGFDRWVAGWWFASAGNAVRRRSEHSRLLAAIESRDAALKQMDDDRLRDTCRQAAAAAWRGGHIAAAAAALAPLGEAARRTLGLSAHPPQLVAAWRLVSGCLVELDTGEGKTFTAALAACVAALAGVPTHVVTVNDYLAQRDARTLAPLFRFLGLTVGVVYSDLAPAERVLQYRRDITYCTNKDLVFDYLRDRVQTLGASSAAQLAARRLHCSASALEPLRLRGLHFAIVDEADSILVDEARTPLILSMLGDGGAGAPVWRAVLDLADGLQEGRHFRLVGEQRIPELLAAGRRELEPSAPDQPQGTASLPEDWKLEWVREHYAVQALRALHVLRRDEHYVVQDGRVVIVDEFTGRLLPDRSWEQGLHQLIETKEGCEPTGQNRTLARITYQTFFARYLRLSGMSGTLAEVARETAAAYRLPTVRVQPHRPCLRVQRPTVVAPDGPAKLAAIVAEVLHCRATGQPVLVGTRSVAASAAVGAALAAHGIAHRILNALQNADEAALVASAGQAGRVTVATNMAGRGTDIPLEPGVAARGGLHVILTEWHESPRVDRQLFGRCARQGEPGSCRAIVALDDDLVRRHGGPLAKWLAAHTAAGVAPLPGQRLQHAAVLLLQGLVQHSAMASNAAQRRATWRYDRQMRQKLAFSGVPE